MATSVQRILMMIVMIHLTLFLVNGFAHGASVSDIRERASQFVGEGSNWTSNLNDDMQEVNPDTSQVTIDRTALNTEVAQKSFAEFVSDGTDGIARVYLGCISQECSTPVGWWLNMGIALFMWAIAILGAYEIIVFIWGKKYT